MTFSSLHRGLLVAAALAAALPAPTTAAAALKPNFLFVYADDMRWDAMGVVQREQGARARFPWLKTPNLDRFAAEGVRFRNAFVTMSLCSPSRAAFLTGRYNHFNGVASNQVPFPVDNVTHASVLRGAGYTTAYIGKWHMSMQRGKRPGFDYSASHLGQGKYVDCPFEIDGVSTPTKGWIDDVSTDYAIDFIRQNRGRPFSMVVGFKTAHVPFSPPERAKGRFAGATIGPVPNRHARAIFQPEDPGGTAAPPPADGTPAWALDYFRCISAIDENFGRLLDALDQSGLSENTVVVFTSDNGYYIGEHRLGDEIGDKRSAYDESMRIPMLVRYPKLLARRALADELVLNVDLAPTFLDLAGVAVPPEMQGKSWAPLLTQADPGWRTAFFYEYFFENKFPETPTMLAVRTSRAKLIKYPGHDDWLELFDLAADPYETTNLARDPAHRALLSRMMEEFDRQKEAVGFRVPDYAERPPPPGSPPAPPRKRQYP